MSRLWHPGMDMEREPTMICRVPVADGEVCGHLFYPGEERIFEGHVGSCARKHAEAIHENSPRTRWPIMDPQMWDPEAEDYLAEVGKRMLREGRLEMLPSERIKNG